MEVIVQVFWSDTLTNINIPVSISKPYNYLLLTTPTMKVLFSENISNSLHICKYARVSTLQQTLERRERSLNKYLMIFSCWLYFICQDVPRAQDNIFKWLLLSDKWSKTLRAGTREELVCHFCVCALIYLISSSLTRMEINCSSLQRLITNNSWTPSNLEFALRHATAIDTLDLRDVWCLEKVKRLFILQDDKRSCDISR